jgi:hypothetical protein
MQNAINILCSPTVSEDADVPGIAANLVVTPNPLLASGFDYGMGANSSDNIFTNAGGEFFTINGVTYNQTTFTNSGSVNFVYRNGTVPAGTYLVFYTKANGTYVDTGHTLTFT